MTSTVCVPSVLLGGSLEDHGGRHVVGLQLELLVLRVQVLHQVVLHLHPPALLLHLTLVVHSLAIQLSTNLREEAQCLEKPSLKDLCLTKLPIRGFLGAL